MLKLKILLKRLGEKKKKILACSLGFSEAFRCPNPLDFHVFGDLAFNASIACRCADLIIIEPGYTDLVFSVSPCKVALTAP